MNVYRFFVLRELLKYGASGVDGDLVWLHDHSTYREGNSVEAMLGIFRVEKGKMEHWDVSQPLPEGAASGNTMFCTR